MDTTKYITILSNLNIETLQLTKFKDFLLNYKIQKIRNDDYHAWVAAILALKSITNGNFGIGSILINGDEQIIAEGYNQVFHPYFRSDPHAEMNVLNIFEDDMKNVKEKQDIYIKDYTLYTSLEPCPMCLARIISSGIGKIKYTVEDEIGGFTRKINELPSAWLKLSNQPYKQSFCKSDCSPDLFEISSDIFLYNADILNIQLRSIYNFEG